MVNYEIYNTRTLTIVNRWLWDGKKQYLEFKKNQDPDYVPGDIYNQCKEGDKKFQDFSERCSVCKYPIEYQLDEKKGETYLVCIANDTCIKKEVKEVAATWQPSTALSI